MAGGSRLRPAVLAAREQLAATRDDIRRRHGQGLPSTQICGRLTSMIDSAIGHLYDAALDDLGTDAAKSLRSSIALVAHGGYGRRHMAPHSDVDLMFLHDGKQATLVKELTTRLTQDVFDCGLQLGQSLRTSTEAVTLARGDAVICTSLIESRLVAGSQDLLEGFWQSFKTMVTRRQSTLCKDFLRARKLERHKYGETVYLLEPNVKRSRGGLRDTHLLRWLWFATAGISDPDRLLAAGMLSKFDHHRLRAARDFLLQVRNQLHFADASGTDQLSRAAQLDVAEAMGFRGRDGLLPVEQFMREYFRHTAHVSFLVNRLTDIVAPTRSMRQVLDPMLSLNITRDFRVGAFEISATPACNTKLKTRLDEVIRLVDLARLHERRIAHETWYLVYRAAPNYSSELTEPVVERFRELMANPMQLGEALRRLRDLGVLEKVVTQFAFARGLLQFNQYHKYTVDEHCIRAVEEATRLAERDDYAGERYRRLKNKELLHLALLIHDLGKGHEEDHSVVGVRIATDVAQRLGLGDYERDTLEFLVGQHLVMAHAAFRRDTSDPELIEKFADDVGSVERLDLLYLLTCADLAAVGPGVLNAWKVGVLSELRQKIEDAMAPDGEFFEQNRRDDLREPCWRLLTDAERSDPWFQEQYQQLPEVFLTGHTPAEVATTLQRLRPLADRRGVAWGVNQPASHTVEFIAGVDQGSGRGIFSSMAGVLASCGMSILAAETVQMARGLMMLRYVVDDSESREPTDAKRIADVAGKLVSSIDNLDPPRFRRIWGREQAEQAAALSYLPNEVRIDAVMSAECAIVEVFTFDRLGLLFQLARALHELQLNIRFAKIGTYLDQVVDVFYVSERDGSKPTGDERLLAIRQKLEAIIDSPEKY